MIVVNFGGGTNSTALLVEAYKRGVRPDLIVFADTGSEMPHTYSFVPRMSDWLVSVGFPPIEVTRWIRSKGELKGQFLALHDWCVQRKTLPSKAFGLAGCTSKWKQQPADKFIKNHPGVVAAHSENAVVERWIGYDASEPERHKRMMEKNPDPHLWSWRAPLIEWDMGREECIKSIESVGLPQPGKSACWMCPSSKKKEILKLGTDYPALLEAALTMEDNAELVSIKGLGRSFSWRSFLQGENEAKKAPEVVDQACGCYDESEE